MMLREAENQRREKENPDEMHPIKRGNRERKKEIKIHKHKNRSKEKSNNDKHTTKIKECQGAVRAQCIGQRFGSFITDTIVYKARSSERVQQERTSEHQITDHREEGAENNNRFHKRARAEQNLQNRCSSFSVEFVPNSSAITLAPASPIFLSAT